MKPGPRVPTPRDPPASAVEGDPDHVGGVACLVEAVDAVGRGQLIGHEGQGHDEEVLDAEKNDVKFSPPPETLTEISNLPIFSVSSRG